MHDLTHHLDDIAGGFMPISDAQTDIVPTATFAPDPPFRPYRTNG